MNAIIGMTNLAMQAHEGNKRQRFLQTVKHSAESLLGLLNDILDFSKMEAGQLQLTDSPFNLHQLIEGIISTMNVPAVENGLRLQVVSHDNLPAAFIGDDLRLRQILLNLVGNAIKFTHSGSVTIDVSMENEISEGKMGLHFVVADTGIGIPPEKLSLIFDNFEQADNSYARKYGGTGLGLSICKQLIGLMGGRIWVESREKVGSSFHFIVQLQPCEKELSITSSKKILPAPKIKGLQILIVDDNEVNRDMASMMLEQDNTVTTATNGLEALTMLASKRFNVVLMDVQMPVMDGLAATAIIRALEQGSAAPKELPENIARSLAERLKDGHIPIVAMTAHAMSEDQEMCLSAGMDRYVTKPFQYEVLSAAFQSLIRENPAGFAPGNRSLQEEPCCRPMNASPQEAQVEDIISYFKSTTNFTDDQVEKLVSAARKSIAENLDKAVVALQGEDYQALRMAAHTLKGTLLQCGLDALAGKADEICDSFRTNASPPYADLLETLKNNLLGLQDKEVAAPRKDISIEPSTGDLYGSDTAH